MIVTSSLNKLFLWSINGQLMVSVDTLGLDSCQKEVTCLSMTQLNEWDAERVIISGHADGYVCVSTNVTYCFLANIIFPINCA